MKQKYELFDKILSFIKNKDVLDVGCVAHKLERSNSPLWVHIFLRKHAKSVLGFDILKEEIDKLRKKGYNVVYANAENFNFSRKFDVIVAGELIEHLSNPGLFLEQCRKHMKKEGLLIIFSKCSFIKNQSSC